MEEIFNSIRNKDGEPYCKVMDDMGLKLKTNREDFIDTTLLFAENCYQIAKKNAYPYKQQMDGHFNWKTSSPSVYYKVYFSYFHTEDLVFAIRGYEEISMEDYSINND